jgi:hypothetical protein
LITTGIGGGGVVAVEVGAAIVVPPAAVVIIIIGAPPAPGGSYLPESRVMNGGGDPAPPNAPAPFPPLCPGAVLTRFAAPPAYDDQGPILLPVDAEHAAMNTVVTAALPRWRAAL